MNKQNSNNSSWPRLKTWLVTSVLLTIFTQAHADKLYDSSYYTMSTSRDHISLTLLVADLVGRDSWLVADSRVVAYSSPGRKGTKYNLVNVYSWDQDGNDNSTHGIKACYDMRGAVAILTNASNQKIAWERTDYYIYKQGNFSYPQAKIDFYWGPQMAGNTWYIYYESKHDNGDTSNFYLGSVNCSTDMGRRSLESNNYSFERTAARTIKFTTPSLPTNNASDFNVSNAQIHEAWYILTLDYTRSDGTIKTQSVKLDCGQVSTPHNIEIPEDVGNYKNVNLRVVAVDALKAKENDEYFYKKTSNFLHTNCMPTVPIPSGLGLEYHQDEDKTDLVWTTYTPLGNSYNYYQNSKPYVYRIETDAKGQPISGQSWKLLGKLNEIGTTRSMSYSDKSSKEANKYYQYMVVNVPAAWENSMALELNNPTESNLKQLGYCRSDLVSTEPVVRIYNLRQDTNDKEHVTLKWEYSRVPVKTSDVTFEIWRSKKDANEWTTLATVKGKANPNADDIAKYTDGTLESNIVRYDYKVTLAINNGVNKYESNVITGSLLKGTSIREFSASKGSHQNAVLLLWQAHQVGTETTHFDIYRRYADSNDEWMKIYSTSGTGESYTYEDNTVQPGYYYEYRVEAYSGEKAQNTTELSALTSIGFCQARGTVSGRITFNTAGSAVEGVRVTLRPGDEGSDNAVQSFAQRVSGPSTGIAWQADSTSIAKVFGPNKDFTIQMFVRPDSLLNEGVIIGEIPGEGRLSIGKRTNDGYELALNRIIKENVVTDLSTLTGHYEAQDGEILTGTLSANRKISIAPGASVKLKDMTIDGAGTSTSLWAAINCPGDATIYLEGENTIKPFNIGYPCIYIAPDKTLTIRGTGSLKATATYGGIAIGGGWEIDGGNINIEGGDIYAVGSYGAAIGGGYYANNGDITISGGNITAIANITECAAIGTPFWGTGGNITITPSVTKVTVKGGENAPASIGRSTGGTCGTVTIGGVVYEHGITERDYIYEGNGSWIYNNQTGDFAGIRYKEAINTGVTLPANIYSLLTISRNGNQLSVQVNSNEPKTLSASNMETLVPFSVGGASHVSDMTAFKGNLSEVRVWDHVLTDKEHDSYHDRVLSGRETGLKLYWPMDEGVDRLVFDASYSNDQPNGRHATVGTNITSSQIIPADNMLSRYGVTNANGEYTIRGIPFVGSGSSYSFIPSKSIHEFTPASRNGFISGGSLALNNIDFTDESSFPLRGKVTYLNTNIPVDSVKFKIDGVEAQNKDGLIYSDDNGQYEISVPIGNHRIEAFLEGHRLTSMPLEPGTYNFMQSEVCNFVDSTLVNVTGRINGGFSDKDEPLGFGRSVNRLGRATLKLSLGREAQSSFNYITDEHGDGRTGTTPLPVESATKNIASTAWRGAGTATSDTEAHYIYIKTDSLTGEFSALLPPLRYKLEEIRFDNDLPGDAARYNNLDFFKQNLPFIDATKAKEGDLKVDSLIQEGQRTEYYKYSAKFNHQLRVTPEIHVVQDDMEDGAFGINSVEVVNDGGQKEEVTVISRDGDKYHYNFGYPLFKQGENYEMTIDVAESYYNVDSKETIREIPQDAIIHVTNEGSTSVSVMLRDTISNGDRMEVSDVWEVATHSATPSEMGAVKYAWTAGYPNLSGNFLRSLDITVKVDGRATAWKAPGSEDGKNALDLVVLGSITTGTNFVSGGPDHVDMILRRPPGSTSYAEFSADTIHSDLTTTSVYKHNKTTGGPYISAAPKFKQQIGVLGATTENEIYPVVDNKLQTGAIDDTVTDSIKGNVYTVSQTIKTPASSTYTQNNGDTYIGRATNMLFGLGHAVNVFKQDDGSWKLESRESISTGKTFGTTFIYAQQYIEDVLIPNWQKMKEKFLVHVSNHLDDSQAVKIPGKVMYYTSLERDDPRWGTSNSDENVWTEDEIKSTGCRPSYRVVDGLDKNEPNITDSVEWCNKQIEGWKHWIAMNEEDKVRAFNGDAQLNGNYSIAGGTTVSQSHKNSRVENFKKTTKNLTVLNTETHAGLLVNNLGIYAIVIHEEESGKGKVTTNDYTYNQTVKWQMSDAEPTTALSVDVYDSPSLWGPIFRTRGGQSSKPYEGATYTKYYQPGTKLDEATMRVENPELRVDGPSTVTDVPTGGQARFNLELINASETNTPCSYVLEAKENTNANGAVLTIDGAVLSSGKSGRQVKMKGGETIKKQLLVTQSDRSITDYEDIAIVLKSENDSSTVSEPVLLRVYFRPTSALVDIKVDHTVLNAELWKNNKGIIVTMENLDRADKGLEGLRVRYRRKGTDSWTKDMEWKVNPAADENQLPDTPIISTAVRFPEDGVYEVQAQTFGLFGSQEVTYETETIEVTQDTHGPKLLGMVSPESGLLTYMNRNNMHIRLNEKLNVNALSKSDNFRIEGGMNNVVYGDGQYPDVAVQLNGERIETDAMFNMTNTDLAFDMWLYRQGDGNIFSLGTDDNMLALSTHNDGQLSARVGAEEDVFETNVQLPKNQWTYVALNYKRKTPNTPDNQLTILYVTADDTQPKYAGEGMKPGDLHGYGKMAIGGEGMQGMISEMTIWNNDVTATELYQKRKQIRAAHTPGLVGYWKMNEGHGTQVTDIARSRHMHMTTESWYINNRNLAVHLDGENQKTLKIDISTFNPSKTDNFAYEMWFRGTDEGTNPMATLLSVHNGSTKEATQRTAIGFDHSQLILKLVEQKNVKPTEEQAEPIVISNTVLSEKSYLDGNWHHLALNVRRGTSAIVYVDGEAVKVLPETSVPGISSHHLMVGGELTPAEETSTNLFTGDVDEIRIWGAALDGKLISDRMYERMDNSYPGLVGYFPMEEISRNQQGTVKTTFSLNNYGEKDSQLKIDPVSASSLTESTNAPALKPGSSKMRMDDSQFDFTASADEIYFTFPDSSLPLMDSNEFVVTIYGIKDEHGNTSEPVSWKFHTDFASVKWPENVADRVRNKSWDTTLVWSEIIENTTGMSQSYEISGMPSWLKVDMPVGTIDSEALLVDFSLGTDVPVGLYTEYLYLTDRLGIMRMMPITIVVTGDVPNWTVDPNRYESNMTLTGQIYIGDKISQFIETKIAAFDEQGLCCGVASPKYVSTRDAYYVDMLVYGGAATSLSTSQRELTFKMYDASTGLIYPVVELTMPDGTKSTSLTYTPDARIGSYNTPVEFRSTDKQEQTVTLPRGWSWMSLNVQPESTAITDILPKDKTKLKTFQFVKSKTAFVSAKSDGSGVNGSLTDIEPGQMYKVQVSSPNSFVVLGKTIDVTQQPQTIHSGFNWIGSLASSVLGIDEAFADLSPEVGDMVKSRTAYAEFGSRGTWEGLLESIVPGEGYVYLSMADHDKTFRYPRPTYNTASSRAQRTAPTQVAPSHYVPESDSRFPDNMTMTAVVEMDGQRLEDVEVAAFIGTECRGATTYRDGYYFLTIMGSSADDKDIPMELRVWYDGTEYVVENDKRFVSDAAFGTLEEPYVLNLDNALTGIRSITADDDDDDDWWSLQGFKLGRKPTLPGIYIHKGVKVKISKQK